MTKKIITILHIYRGKMQKVKDIIIEDRRNHPDRRFAFCSYFEGDRRSGPQDRREQ